MADDRLRASTPGRDAGRIAGTTGGGSPDGSQQCTTQAMSVETSAAADWITTPK